MALELWPQFTGGSYFRTRSYADSERSVNFYPETSGKAENNRSQFRLQSTPGIELAVDLNVALGLAGPVYDLITAQQVTGGGLPRTFALVQGTVAGGIYLVEYRGPSLAPLLLGAVCSTPNGNQVFPKMVACGQDQLLIINGDTVGIGTSPNFSGCVYDMAANTFSFLITGSTSGWVGGSDCDYVDGYSIIVQPRTQTFYISALQDAASYDPLDVAVENDAPDTIVGCRVVHRDLFIFGKSRIMVWNNTGAAQFPFSRNNSATIEVGCMGPATIQKLNDTLFWLGRDQRGGIQAWKMQGYNPVRISTPAVEAIWQNFYAADAAGGSESTFVGLQCFAYEEEGHQFYVVNFPFVGFTSQGFSWVWDDIEGQWHERLRGTLLGCLQQRCHAFNPQYGHVVGSRFNGKLYTQNRNIGSEEGTPISRLRITPHLYQGSQRNFYRRLVLDIDPAAAHTITMQYSIDGTENYTPISTPTVTTRGSGQRVSFNRLGSGVDRYFAINAQSGSPISIAAAYLDVAGGVGGA